MTKLGLLLAAAVCMYAQPAAHSPAWAASAKVAPAAVGTAPNSAAFGSQVYFAGQPSEADIAEYKKLGVKTIVNLRMPAETANIGFDEAATAKAAGINYVSVPFPAVMPPDGDLAKIYAELNKAGDGKVLLHCASSNRAGMVWAVYRGTQHGVPAEAALSEGKAAGLKSPALEKLAREKLAAK